MINLTKLLCDAATSGDDLRYEGLVAGGRRRSNLERRPVVVWNLTRRCNLRCSHCYSESQDREYPGELSTAEARAVIDDLAGFKVPVLLFSGGEPILRTDLFELAEYAVQRGLRAVLSTNGTLIAPDIARRIKDAGFSYVGVSLDGLEATHDRFRGRKGAFRDSLEGMRHCLKAGVKVGLRLTLTRHNISELPDIFRLLEGEGIPRCCFYHLAYAGRGRRLADQDLTPSDTRQAMDLIFRETVALHSRSPEAEVLTVDNHADAVYLYLKVKEEQPGRAAQVYRLLEMNGGNASGVAIGAINNLGEVHADQFWGHYSFGNVRRRPFSQIWMDTSNPLMAGLKDRASCLKGRCRECHYLKLCNGNLRVRAEAVYGDVWAPDPACYLTDEEVGITAPALAS